MAQTRQQIIELLTSIGREPNRKLGQHFMAEKPLIERLVAEGCPPGDGGGGPLILEVGPGTGTLTESLLAGGAEVLAVEIDHALADLVESEVGRRFPGRLHLVRGDVLAGKHHLNREMLTELARRCVGRGARLVANLPYNIACPLLAGLVDMTWRAVRQSRMADGGLANGQPTGVASNPESEIPNPTSEMPAPVAFDRLVFTVQREVADRLTAAPDTKEYGPMSVLCQGLGVVQSVMHRISPKAFYPVPNVFSAMLRIDLPAERVTLVPDLEALHVWLETGFGHRRKTLSASIRLAETDWQVRLTAAALSVGLDLGRRGETLTVAEYLALAGQT